MNWLKYLALIALLSMLVYAYPILWEVGVVGALAGAFWIFAWPKPGRGE